MSIIYTSKGFYIVFNGDNFPVEFEGGNPVYYKDIEAAKKRREELAA